MFMFFRRLVGIESAQREERERFRRNLNGFDDRAEELEDIEGQLAIVVKTVDEKQDSIRAARRQGSSGEHILNLTLMGDGRDGEEAGM